MSDTYWTLPKSDRWLADDSPAAIGGRSTDVEQIAFSLRHNVGQLYNYRIPDDVEAAWQTLYHACQSAEEEIAAFIEYVSTHLPRGEQP